MIFVPGRSGTNVLQIHDWDFRPHQRTKSLLMQNLGAESKNPRLPRYIQSRGSSSRPRYEARSAVRGTVHVGQNENLIGKKSRANDPFFE